LKMRSTALLSKCLMIGVNLRHKGMSEIILKKLLFSLDWVALERLNDATFRVISEQPSWFSRLYFGVYFNRNGLVPEENLSFLDDFLITAERFWLNNTSGRLESGPWTETDSSGKEFRFEASAICLETTKILLIQSINREFKEKQTLLQKARERELTLDRLTKELQETETLIHCVTYDMKEPLLRITEFFRTINPGKLDARERQSLEICRRQAQRLEKLIQEFSDTAKLTIGENVK
jgi:signal transduction histidine kinase